jgi:hypothetical protein
MARIIKPLTQLFLRLLLKYFTDFRLETALSTEFKTENGASILVFLAVEKRKSTPPFFPAGHEITVLKEPIDRSEVRF